MNKKLILAVALAVGALVLSFSAGTALVYAIDWLMRLLFHSADELTLMKLGLIATLILAIILLTAIIYSILKNGKDENKENSSSSKLV